MTFTYEGADLSTTIKSFVRNGCHYHITYLDGSESHYYCSNDGEEERLYNLLLEQVLERDANVQLKELELTKELLKFMMFLSSFLFLLTADEKKSITPLLSILIGIFSIKNYNERRKRFNELKKYRIFIELMDRIKCVSESVLLKCVEFEKIYQKPLNLVYLDEYSLGDMKRIRKELPKLEQKRTSNELL